MKKYNFIKLSYYAATILFVVFIFIKIMYARYPDDMDIEQIKRELYMLEMQELLSFSELDYEDKILDQTYYSNLSESIKEQSRGILQTSWDFCKEHKILIFGCCCATVVVFLIGYNAYTSALMAYELDNLNHLNHEIATHIRNRGFYHYCMNTLNGANGISTYVPNDLAKLMINCPPHIRFTLFSNIQPLNGAQTMLYLPGKIEQFSDKDLVLWYRSWQTWVEARLNDWQWPQ